MILAVCAFQLWITPDNPPGFFRDEASLALDASTLSTSLHDSNGAVLPLYISTFEDYFSPVFVYALAVVFRVTGPHAEVARGLSAAGILAAVLLLGLLAYRRTGDRTVGVLALVLAGTTPWLFEVGRLAFEVGFEPLVIVLLLLALDRASPRFLLRSAVSIGLALGLLVYVYAAGRLLGPLYAASLVVFLSRARLRWLLTIWATFAITLAPIALYAIRHPGALSARFHATTFIDDGDPVSQILRIFARHVVSNLTPWYWLTGDDTAPRHHIVGAPAILLPLVALAAVGLVTILTRKRGDVFYRFILVIFVLSVIPASLTGGTHHVLRLVPLPVLLVVIAIPGIELLVRWARQSRSGRVVAAALALGVLLQLTQFIVLYQRDGPKRLTRSRPRCRLSSDRCSCTEDGSTSTTTIGGRRRMRAGSPPSTVSPRTASSCSPTVVFLLRSRWSSAGTRSATSAASSWRARTTTGWRAARRGSRRFESGSMAEAAED